MMIRSRIIVRPLVLPVLLLSLQTACTDGDQPQALAGVETINIPVADTTTRVNFNIDNPSLTVPATVPVADGDNLKLVWSDEFNAEQLDPETWFFATGDGSEAGLPSGWGNNELQWYLPDNAKLEDGKLKITALREQVGDFGYTSARLNTKDRIAIQYGRIEARIKLPGGQGIWPAFWMFPQSNTYGSFSASGEIDIVEAVNLDALPSPSGLGGGNELFGTIHFGGEFPANQSASVNFEPSEDITAGFHNYAVEWDETEIRWYFNGILYAVQNSWNSTGGAYPAPFDHPFYILLNVAVGGNFPGSPNNGTEFPAVMEVDWVRVFSGEFEPASQGDLPNSLVFTSNDEATATLAPPGFDNFGSGAVFDAAFNGDADFKPALKITSGEGYGAGVHVGFVAFTGYDAGFANNTQTLQFKVKANTENLTSFEVKFFQPDVSRSFDLTTYSGVEALGNGWLQVSIPMSEFASDITLYTGFLLGPNGGQGSAFTYLLTDIGFN